MKKKETINKKKPNILLIVFLSFFGFLLFVVLLITTLAYINRDEIHRGERIKEQLLNNQYLKKNIDNYYVIKYETIDIKETKEQTHRCLQLIMGNGRYVIVDVWYKNEKYDWQFDSVKIVRPPGKYARMKEQTKYKFKNR